MDLLEGCYLPIWVGRPGAWSCKYLWECFSRRRIRQHRCPKEGTHQACFRNIKESSEQEVE